MKKVFVIVALLFSSIVLIMACSTINPKSTEVYTVATGSNFRPFEFLNETTGEVDGFDIDLMKVIAEEADFEIKFEIVSWDGFIAAMQTGRFDIGIDGVTITEERKQKVDFSAPYYRAGLIIMVKVNNLDIKSEQDLVGKKIGTVTQTTSEKYLRENIPEARIFAYAASPEAYMDLRSGRLDAVLHDATSIKFYISKEAGDELKTVGDVIQGEEYGILFPIGSPLKERVNQALQRLIEKGIYDDIYEKWFNERPCGTKKA